MFVKCITVRGFILKLCPHVHVGKRSAVVSLTIKFLSVCQFGFLSTLNEAADNVNPGRRVTVR